MVERSPQAVDIGPNVHAQAVHDDLGRHVIRRSHHALVVLAGQLITFSLEESRQPQIQHLDHALAIHEEVVRLDIPVDQPDFLVGVLQAERGLANVVGGGEDIEPTLARDELLKVRPVDEFHHQEMQVLILVDVIGMDNIRVIQRRHGPRLAVEALEGRRVLGHRGGQDLNRHAPAHQPMLAQVHQPHAAGAEAVEDLVFADDEPPPLALQQSARLERRQDPVSRQQPRQFRRLCGQRS